MSFSNLKSSLKSRWTTIPNFDGPSTETRLIGPKSSIVTLKSPFKEDLITKEFPQNNTQRPKKTWKEGPWSEEMVPLQDLTKEASTKEEDGTVMAKNPRKKRVHDDRYD